RAVAAEGVVALEVVGREVVDVDVLAGGDVGAGEADDLAVLVDRLALLDRPQRDLVAHADARRQRDRVAVDPQLRPRRQVTGRDGDVVFGAQVNGDLRKRDGWHEVGLRMTAMPSRYRSAAGVANRRTGANQTGAFLVCFTVGASAHAPAFLEVPMHSRIRVALILAGLAVLPSVARAADPEANDELPLEVVRTFAPLKGFIQTAALSPDEKLIAAGARLTDTLFVWEME